MIYSTGVVQSLSASSRELLRESFRIAKENEVLTAYDPNYTSCFMNSDDTKEYFEEIIDFTDVIFLSLKNDATKLYEFDSHSGKIRQPQYENTEMFTNTQADILNLCFAKKT